MPEDKEKGMWLRYQVELQMTGRFAASLPRTKEEIAAMLQHRMPANPPDNYTPVDELTEEVAAKVGADLVAEAAGEAEEEEVKFGWATFPSNDGGIYYEGRCVRGHLKDCAMQVRSFIKPEIKALKAKVANKVYVMTDIIPLGVKEVAGTETRYVQVMTMQGPRSTIKYVDYLEKPALLFELKVLNDGVITLATLEAIFDYGSIHGLGQERSQGWGRYEFKITELPQPAAQTESRRGK
ncbi:hypothetical protein LCGC14_1862490 [marine sediment metagenome]|uniref:Uncharacterized protein n=1 Tax=marine sediment metagenome TaxID=412755 RepID=A0A0F9G7G7_9ZZZZ